MNTEMVWDAIGIYHHQTFVPQIIMIILLTTALMLSISGVVKWAAKAVFGIAHIYIAVVYFGIFAVMPVQRYLALPLFLIIGILYLIETVRHIDDEIQTPDEAQTILILLAIAYPLCSLLLGHTMPHTTTYIMPSPILSIAIMFYCCHTHRNPILLALAALWGMLRIRNLFLFVWEDAIVVTIAVYCICKLISDVRLYRKEKTTIIRKKK